jgi:hypothetical protein
MTNATNQINPPKPEVDVAIIDNNMAEKLGVLHGSVFRKVTVSVISQAGDVLIAPTQVLGSCVAPDEERSPVAMTGMSYKNYPNQPFTLDTVVNQAMAAKLMYPDESLTLRVKYQRTIGKVINSSSHGRQHYNYTKLELIFDTEKKTVLSGTWTSQVEGCPPITFQGSDVVMFSMRNLYILQEAAPKAELRKIRNYIQSSNRNPKASTPKIISFANFKIDAKTNSDGPRESLLVGSLPEHVREIRNLTANNQITEARLLGQRLLECCEMIEQGELDSHLLVLLDEQSEGKSLLYVNDNDLNNIAAVLRARLAPKKSAKFRKGA